MYQHIYARLPGPFLNILHRRTNLSIFTNEIAKPFVSKHISNPPRNTRTAPYRLLIANVQLHHREPLRAELPKGSKRRGLLRLATSCHDSPFPSTAHELLHDGEPDAARRAHDDSHGVRVVVPLYCTPCLSMSHPPLRSCRGTRQSGTYPRRCPTEKGREGLHGGCVADEAVFRSLLIGAFRDTWGVEMYWNISWSN